MRLLIKLLITISVITACSYIGKKIPSLAGLIAVMPLTGLLVLLWIYTDSSGDNNIMLKYTKGALWGIVPSILFFAAAFVCFKKNLPLPITLLISSGIWIISAFVHQWALTLKVF